MRSSDTREEMRRKKNIAWYTRASHLTPFGIIAGIIVVCMTVWNSLSERTDGSAVSTDIFRALLLLGGCLYVHYAVARRLKELTQQEKPERTALSPNPTKRKKR